jgi:TPR repeat protein
MTQKNSALGEGFYWMAEKLAWGYEDVEINHAEAFKLFRQAAELGFSDARIRMGEFQENGKGTKPDPSAALKSYLAAARAGNFYALAFLASLLARSSHLAQAQAAWQGFFVALAANPEPGFFAATRGELLHNYIETQLRLGLEPGQMDALRRYRLEIVGHQQRLLETAADDRVDRLEGISKWVELNLGPWPVR